MSYWCVKSTATPALHMAAVRIWLLWSHTQPDIIVCATDHQAGGRSLYCNASCILLPRATVMGSWTIVSYDIQAPPNKHKAVGACQGNLITLQSFVGVNFMVMINHNLLFWCKEASPIWQHICVDQSTMISQTSQYEFNCGGWHHYLEITWKTCEDEGREHVHKAMTLCISDPMVQWVRHGLDVGVLFVSSNYELWYIWPITVLYVMSILLDKALQNLEGNTFFVHSCVVSSSMIHVVGWVVFSVACWVPHRTLRLAISCSLPRTKYV